MSGQTSHGGVRVAVDTGGTFTDLAIDGLEGGQRFYKRPTTPNDPILGLVDVIEAAARDLGIEASELLGRTDSFIHGTTRATNAIVEGKTARTAFLTTAGHRDILLVREGGGRATPLDYTQAYPDPYVPRSHTFELTERVRSDGAVARPLDEQGTIETIGELRRLGIEAVAVCLLWSIVNPDHEERVGELLDEHLPGVPYTLSHRLNPTVREYRRASSAAIDASLKPLMSTYIRDLDRRLRDHGFRGRLLILTSAGGVLDAEHVWDAPIHSIGSGPAAAPVAGRHYSQIDAGSDYAVVTDAGGTTYDVSLIRGGRIPWTRETMVGHPKQGYITGFPSVDVKSIGAGGGSIGWVDDGGLLHVGPQSAGADPGPVCWGRGGRQPTVTDACVVLGYIDPSYFLGGEIEIDADAAAEAIVRDVGEPLALDRNEAAAAILNLASERMVTAIEEITLNQGLDPREAVLVGGGGGAGLYAVAIARRLGSKRIIIPAASAALSAAGALLSDLTADMRATEPVSTAAFDGELANRTLRELSARCERFIEGPGAGSSESEVTFAVEARYPDQVWEIEVPLPGSRLDRPGDVEAFKRAFHRVHEGLFAVSDPTSEVEIVSWRAHVRCVLPGSTYISAPMRSEHAAPRPSRRAYFPEIGISDAAVRRFEVLEPGESLAGPALVESHLTTVVVPPGARVERLRSGSLLIHPWAEDSPLTPDAAEAATAGGSR